MFIEREIPKDSSSLQRSEMDAGSRNIEGHRAPLERRSWMNSWIYKHLAPLELGSRFVAAWRDK